MLAPNTDVQSVLQAGSGTRQKRLFRRPLTWGVVGLAVLGALVWWSGRASESAVTYKTAPVTRGDLTIAVAATGTVQPINQVEVGSELSGILRTVKVDYNDRVNAGEVLAEINTDKLTAQANRAGALVAAARANVTQAEATVRETRTELDRITVLVGRSSTTLKDQQSAQAAYDRAVAALASAEAQVKVAEADLASNQTDLGKAEIRSPIGGIVLSRNVDPGQTVAATLQAPVLFTIAEDLAKMHLLVDIDEADAGSVKEGQEAVFTVEAYPERKFAARVLQLRYAPETVNGVVTYKAVLSVDNADLSLRPGMTATAEIITRKVADALLVPNAAFRYQPPETAGVDTRNFVQRMMPRPPPANLPKAEKLPAGQRRVYVLRDGVPAPVIIAAGQSDGTATEVVGGDLAEGMPLVTDSAAAR